MLDEADKMMDMGFSDDILNIVRQLPNRAADAAVFGHHAQQNPGVLAADSARTRRKSGWP
ncbi:MAG: hypothetical protein WKG07_42505 [Hymenobacter sp.]